MSAALATTTTAPRSPVRLRPTPPLEPPYDDELAGAGPADQGIRPIGPYDVELPLDWGRPRRALGRTAPRQRPAKGSSRTAVRPEPTGWRIMSDDEAPLAIKRFLDMYVEVLNERRPLRHLLSYASDEVFQSIQLSLTRRGKGWWPVGRQPVTRRTVGPTALRTRPVPIRVRRIRPCQLADGVVEIAAVLHRGDEVRALAVRLERNQRQWVCTALEFIG